MPEFRVFISSTFRDLIRERHILQEVFSQLRSECRERGHDLKVVDLRWGISVEEQRQGRTMEVCLQEIAHCQSISPRPNFLVLLGDRYGWEPAPDRIETTEFQRLLAQMGEPARRAVEDLYSVDENAVPAVRLLRRDLLQSGPTDEGRLVRLLRAAVESAGWTSDDPRVSKYLFSATHQEVLRGALGADAQAPEQHVLVTVRDRCSGPAESEELEQLAALESALEQRLGATNLYRYGSAGSGREPADPRAFAESVLAWYRRVLGEEMDKAERAQGAREGDGEKARHKAAARNKSQVFVGREQQVEELLEALADEDVTSIKVTGGGGSGKSAFLATALQALTSGSPSRPGSSVEEVLEVVDYVEYEPPAEPARDNSGFFGVDRSQNPVPQDVEDIRETITGVLSTEAPVHVDVLCHKVSRRWGMKSYTTRTRRAMEPFLADPALVELQGEFCWRPGAVQEVVVPRTSSPKWREGSHIHMAEVKGALRALLSKARAEGRGSLKLKRLRSELKRLFGVSKGARDLSETFSGCLSWAESLGWEATATTLAQTAAERSATDRQGAWRGRVVARFVGETDRSTTYADLLNSIIEELLPSWAGPLLGRGRAASQDQDAWLQALKAAGAEEPVVIMLDGVDQLLSAPAAAHAIVPQAMPKGITLVISTTSEAPNWLPRDSEWSRVMALPGFSAEHAKGALDGWLGTVGRRLTAEQSDAVMSRAMEVGEGQALFLRLSAGAASRWESRASVVDRECAEASPLVDLRRWEGVQGLICSELERLDRLHTGELASKLVSLVTASRYGLSEKEIQGSLQQLPGFWEAFVEEQHSDHREALAAAGSIPDSVLLRLLGDLKGSFLKEWSGSYRPAHRLIGVHAGGTEAERREAAGAIADYFLASGEGWFLDQGSRPSIPNRRKVQELPSALEAAGRFDELLESCLANTTCLAAAAMAGELEDLMSISIPEGCDFSELAASYRNRLRGAPPILFEKPTVDLVEEVLDSGRASAGAALPKLTGLAGFRLLDLDVPTMRALFGDGRELQEWDLTTGQMINQEPGAGGLLIHEDGPKWLILREDGSVALTGLDRGEELQSLLPPRRDHGADPEPVSDLGGGRMLRVYPDRITRTRSRVVGLDSPGGRIVLRPGHTNTIKGLAWSEQCAAIGAGRLVVASAGTDRFLRLYLVDESNGNHELLYERKFTNRLMGVSLAGQEDEYLVVLELDAEPLCALWLLDLRGSPAAWDDSWELVRRDVTTWPDSARAGAARAGASSFWIGTAAGVVELDLIRPELERLVLSTGSDARLSLEVVAPGVGYAMYTSMQESGRDGRSTRLEHHVLFCTAKELVELAVVEAFSMGEPRQSRVQRAENGALFCLESAEGERLVVRDPRTLEPRKVISLPRPRDLGYPEYDLGSETWSAIERLVGGGVRVTNSFHEYGVYLDLDEHGKVVGQRPWLGAERVGSLASRVDVDPDEPRTESRAVRSEDGLQVVRVGPETFLRRPGEELVRLPGPSSRVGRAPSQRFIAEDSFVSVDQAGLDRLWPSGESEHLELLPLEDSRVVSSGERPALIAGDGTFWCQRTGVRALTSWAHSGLACLDAEGVRGGAWVVATMSSLHRMARDGEVELLAEAEGAVVRLLGCDGEAVLCEVGRRLLLASAKSVRELDRSSIPSGEPRLHRFHPGVLLIEDRTQGLLTSWTLERGVVATVETASWETLEDTFTLAELDVLAEGRRGRSSYYRCIPGGLAYRDGLGWRATDVPLGGSQDRPLDRGRVQLSGEDWAFEVPEGVPEEARSICVVRGAVAWLSDDGELYTAEVVEGALAEPMLRGKCLGETTLKGSWAHGLVHVFEELRGLCWSMNCRDGARTVGVPYKGPIVAALEEGELLVRHSAGLVLSDDGSWEENGAQFDREVEFTLSGRDMVTREPGGLCVRSTRDNQVLASFSVGGRRESPPALARELLIFEESPGVFACERPGSQSLGAALDPSGEERVDGRYSKILGVDADTDVLVCALGVPQAKAEADGGGEGEWERVWGDDEESGVMLLRPGAAPVRVPCEGNLFSRTGGLPVLRSQRGLQAVQVDGTLRPLEVPTSWWSSFPEKMEVAGPGERLCLNDPDDPVVYDWLFDGSLSSVVELPEGWDVERVLGVGLPIVLSRWVASVDSTKKFMALFDPESGALGEQLEGSWKFRSMGNGGLLAIHDPRPDSMVPLEVFRSDRGAPTRLVPCAEIERPQGQFLVLVADTYRECLWALTADRVLRRISAGGEVTCVALPELHELGTPRQGEELEYKIDVLPAEVVVRRGGKAASGLVLTLDPVRYSAQVIDFLPGRESEALQDLRATDSNRYVLIVEDLALELSKKERYLLRVGTRAPGGEMELGEACRPWTDLERRWCSSGAEGLVPMDAGLGVVESGPSGSTYRLLAWEDLKVLREELLPGSSCTLHTAHCGEGGVHLMGDTWAAYVPHTHGEPVQTQVWSPSALSSFNGERSPMRCETSERSLSIRFSNGAEAGWDADGRLLRMVPRAPSLTPLAGAPTCALVRAGKPLLVGGEAGQVRILRENPLLLTSRPEAREQWARTWPIVALYPVGAEAVLAVHRCGVVDLLDLEDERCRFSWEPYPRSGSVRPLTDLAYQGDDGLLLQRLTGGVLKVMDVMHGRVWKAELDQGACLAIEAFGPGRVAVQVGDDRVDLLRCGADTAISTERELESARLVHAVPGKSWVSAVQTPEGMLIPGTMETLPVCPSSRAEVVASLEGGAWACLYRKKVTVLDRRGKQVLEASLGQASISKWLEVRADSKLERPPLGISPKGGTVAVFLESEGGSLLRLLRVSDGREKDLKGVKDCWFTDEESCILIKEDGSLEECVPWTGGGPNKVLAPPVAGLLATYDLPSEGEVWVYEDRARVFRGTQDQPVHQIELEGLGKESLKRLSLSPCGEYLAEARQQGVISIYRLTDGEELSPPILFDGGPEWAQVSVARGRVWGLTMAGEVLTRSWKPW